MNRLGLILGSLEVYPYFKGGYLGFRVSEGKKNAIFIYMYDEVALYKNQGFSLEDIQLIEFALDSLYVFLVGNIKESYKSWVTGKKLNVA